MFWNLQQLAACLSLVSEQEPLVEALNGFSAAYRTALIAAMLNRLGVTPRGGDADIALANAAFRALASGGERLRWEPFFFDWFGGTASEARAMAGPRADLYADAAFADFREQLAGFAPDRPGRLAHPMFAEAEPCELLYDEIEAIWARIAEADDWAPFAAKLARIEAARQAWDLSPQPAQ